HKDIGDQMRANADPAVDLATSISEYLMQKLLLRRDRLFASNYLTTGQWSADASSDPFTDIANQQTTILQNTGMMANTLTLGWQVYQALRKHPLVIDRVKYTMQADAKNITPELLAS